MADYSFVVNSSFNPFTLQEMLVPFNSYKQNYQELEENYNALNDKTESLKDLPDGKAKDIYTQFSNDLEAAEKDFSEKGLSMNNKKAFSELRRRYHNEIKQLERTDKEYRDLLNERRALDMKDPTMLYAETSPTVDDFLPGKEFNRYAISGNDLYAKGVLSGKSLSSRKMMRENNSVGNALNAYYINYIDSLGFSPEQLSQFRDEILNDFTARVQTLPELQDAANDILESSKANDNLTGEQLEKARIQVIRGLVDGAIYKQEYKSVQKDPRNMDGRASLEMLKHANRLDELERRFNLQGQERDEELNRKMNMENLRAQNAEELARLRAELSHSELDSNLHKIIARDGVTDNKSVVINSNNPLTMSSYKIADGEMLTPISFEAWNENADVSTFDTPSKKSEEYVMNNYNSIDYSKVRKWRDFIIQSLRSNYSVIFNDLEDNEIEALLKAPDSPIEILEEDNASDNVYIIRFKGVDAEGKISNNMTFNRALSVINKYKTQKINSNIQYLNAQRQQQREEAKKRRTATPAAASEAPKDSIGISNDSIGISNDSIGISNDSLKAAPVDTVRTAPQASVNTGSAGAELLGTMQE